MKSSVLTTKGGGARRCRHAQLRAAPHAHAPPDGRRRVGRHARRRRRRERRPELGRGAQGNLPHTAGRRARRHQPRREHRPAGRLRPGRSDIPRRGGRGRARALLAGAPVEPAGGARVLPLPRRPAPRAGLDDRQHTRQLGRRRLPARRPLRLLQAGRARALRPALRVVLPRRLRLPLLQALRRLRGLRPRDRLPQQRSTLAVRADLPALLRALPRALPPVGA